MGGCTAFRFFLGRWEGVWAAEAMVALERVEAAAGSLATEEVLGLAKLVGAEVVVAQPEVETVVVAKAEVWAAAVGVALVTFGRHRRERRFRHGTALWSRAAAFRDLSVRGQHPPPESVESWLVA